MNDRIKSNIVGYITLSLMFIVAFFLIKWYGSHIDSFNLIYQFIGVFLILFYVLPASSIKYLCDIAEVRCNPFLCAIPIFQEFYIGKLASQTEMPNILSAINIPLIGAIACLAVLVGSFIPIPLIMRVCVSSVIWFLIVYICARGLGIYYISRLKYSVIKSFMFAFIFVFQPALFPRLEKMIRKDVDDN